MDELAAFLAARLDEDEAAAKAAGEDHVCPDARGGHWQDVGDRHVRYGNGSGETLRSVDVTGGPCLWYEQIKVRGDMDGHVAAHIARHDPARALREVAAKRKRLALYLNAEEALAAALKNAPPEDPAVAHSYVRERISANQASGRFTALEMSVRLDASVWSGHPDYRKEWAL